jgi:hypothetical protein
MNHALFPLCAHGDSLWQIHSVYIYTFSAVRSIMHHVRHSANCPPCTGRLHLFRLPSIVEFRHPHRHLLFGSKILHCDVSRPLCPRSPSQSNLHRREEVVFKLKFSFSQKSFFFYLSSFLFNIWKYSHCSTSSYEGCFEVSVTFKQDLNLNDRDNVPPAIFQLCSSHCRNIRRGGTETTIKHIKNIEH